MRCQIQSIQAMAMTKTIFRTIQLALLITTIAVIVVAFYFEYIKGLQPCPLCLMQRLCAFLFGLLALAGLSVTRLNRVKPLLMIQGLFAAFGLFFAARQTWMQFWPNKQAKSCMPNFEMLVHYFSNDQIFKALFWGAGDCGEVTGRWLGLSIPVWSVFYFLSMLLVCVVFYILVRRELVDVKLT